MSDGKQSPALPSLSCHVVGSEHNITACCPDLEIIATGSTQEEAETRLKAAIFYQINQW